MKKVITRNRRLAAFVIVLLVAFQFTACTQLPLRTRDASASGIPLQGSYEENREYLDVYFGINAETAWNTGTFSSALGSVSASRAAVEGDLTRLSAMKAAVTASGYDELAKSYPPEKTAARLANYSVPSTGDADLDAYLAGGLDAGLFSGEQAQAAVTGASLTKEYAAELLMTVAQASGQGRNYMGYSDDPMTDTRLTYMWNSFQIFDDPVLTEIGRASVERQITTGYGLKKKNYAARFLPSLTLQYGHSNIKHAHQLLALLNSEGIIAKVQLEPKVSVYQYLLEWGPVPAPSPGYEVRQFGNDLYLAFAMEYDLLLEFKSHDDALRFDGIIQTYAKKWEGNSDAIGLIYGSWWQPLYTSTRDDMPTESYYKIHDCIIRNGDYSIHPFCLDAKFTDTVRQLNAINPQFQVEPVTRYCNKAFYNYMTGDDFQ